jgi:hypothetical protein
VQSFCQPVYEAFMEEAVATGRIDAPGFFDDPALRRAYCLSAWHGDAMPQVDPLKDINAAIGRVELGVSDRAQETAQMTGGDWETTHREQVREMKMRTEGGLSPIIPPEAAKTPNPKALSEAGGADVGGTAAPGGTDTENETTAPPPADVGRPGKKAALEPGTPLARLLNGNEAAAAAGIVQAVASGAMPRDAGLATLATFFRLTAAQAATVMGSAGTDRFTPPAPVTARPLALRIVRGADGKAAGVEETP